MNWGCAAELPLLRAMPFQLRCEPANHPRLVTRPGEVAPSLPGGRVPSECQWAAQSACPAVGLGATWLKNEAPASFYRPLTRKATAWNPEESRP